jgi:hypothetical protein
MIPMPSEVIEHVNSMTDDPCWEYQDETTEDDLLNVKITGMMNLNRRH